MYNNAYAPPVNNLLQPDIYNRLDAEAIERTRVANTQLDERLRVQERILSKYRLAAERFHRREKARVKEELTRISTKLPAACRIKDFRSKFLYGMRRNSMPAFLQSERKIRGVPEDKSDLPFCERYFIHHLPTKKKYYRRPTPSPPIKGTRPVEGHEGPVDEATGGPVAPSGDVAGSLPPLDTVSENVNENETGPQSDLKDGHVKLSENGFASGVDSGVGGSVNSQHNDVSTSAAVNGANKEGESSGNGRRNKSPRKSPRRQEVHRTPLPPIADKNKTLRAPAQL